MRRTIAGKTVEGNPGPWVYQYSDTKLVASMSNHALRSPERNRVGSQNGSSPPRKGKGSQDGAKGGLNRSPDSKNELIEFTHFQTPKFNQTQLKMVDKFQWNVAKPVQRSQANRSGSPEKEPNPNIEESNARDKDQESVGNIEPQVRQDLLQQ